MSRVRHTDHPGAIFHVTQRGNNRNTIFLKPHEKRRLLYLLYQILTRCDTTLLAYVIMDNHYHMVFESGTTTLSTVMRSLNTQYAKYHNYLYRRTGHVFESRYWASEILSRRQLIRTIRYLAYNPVRAGLCASPKEYPWGSHHGMCVGSDSLIDVKRLFALIEEGPKASRTDSCDYERSMKQYRTYIEDPQWSDGSGIPHIVHRYLLPEERLVMIHEHLEHLDMDVISFSSDRDLFLILAMREGISRQRFISYVKQKMDQRFQP